MEMLCKSELPHFIKIVALGLLSVLYFIWAVFTLWLFLFLSPCPPLVKAVCLSQMSVDVLFL